MKGREFDAPEVRAGIKNVDGVNKVMRWVLVDFGDDARVLFQWSPSWWRRRCSSWPVESFSFRRTTPPLRLTSSVSAVCLTTVPVEVAHDASTGMRRLTRSLCRRPSDSVVMACPGKSSSIRLTRKKEAGRLAKRGLSFQVIVITCEGHGLGGCGLRRVLPFSLARRFEKRHFDLFAAH